MCTLALICVREARKKERKKDRKKERKGTNKEWKEEIIQKQNKGARNQIHKTCHFTHTVKPLKQSRFSLH